MRALNFAIRLVAAILFVIVASGVAMALRPEDKATVIEHVPLPPPCEAVVGWTPKPVCLT